MKELHNRFALFLIIILSACQAQQDPLIDSWYVVPIIDESGEQVMISHGVDENICTFNSDNTVVLDTGYVGKWSKEGSIYSISFKEEPTIYKFQIKNDQLHFDGGERVYERLSTREATMKVLGKKIDDLRSNRN